MKKSKKQIQGAALLVYLLIMVFFVVVLMAATYSRLLLAVKRTQSTTDTLKINYEAESEISDWIAKLSGGYIKTNPFNINVVKNLGSTTLTITGTQTGNVQKIVVEADRPFASTKIEAERTVESLGTGGSADILLGLDCTQSMNETDSGDTKTRIANLKTAAINFVNAIPNNGRFTLGVYVFGVDAKWLTTASGQEINLDNNVPFSQIAASLDQKLGDDWDGSEACKTIMNATSVGTAFTFAQDYFKSRSNSNKKAEIIITDGEPNSRIPYAGCAPSIYCPFSSGAAFCPSAAYGACSSNNTGNRCVSPAVDFLACSVADTNTFYKGTSKGVRDPSINAYAVTISTQPLGSAATVFRNHLGDNYFPANRAGELTGLLSKILTDILATRETINIKKGTPGF